MILDLYILCAATASVGVMYSTNVFCKKNYCINPIFPGLNDLRNLENERWTCADLTTVNKYMGFCKNAVNYHSSLRIDGNQTEAAVVAQDQKAITLFAYHLSGMGLEFWDYREPENARNPCVEAVWRLACYVHFPKTPANCKPGDDIPYVRPCENTCTSYIRSCNVECCDESVVCVFEHSVRINATDDLKISGFNPARGPSDRCTGASHQATMFWILGALVAVYAPRRVAFIALLASPLARGWDIEESHRVGNWRGKPDYLSQFDYIPHDGSAANSVLNSCSLPLAATEQCSGRGTCTAWDTANTATTVMFCACLPEWADPECRTRRKSQAVAYVLSLFTGFLGADLLYLGFPLQAVAKLCSLGGFGFWWAYDIVRIGGNPVYSSQYRVTANVPRWVFVTSSVFWAAFLGMLLALRNTKVALKRKRNLAFNMLAEEQYGAASQIPLAKRTNLV